MIKQAIFYIQCVIIPEWSRLNGWSKPLSFSQKPPDIGAGLQEFRLLLYLGKIHSNLTEVWEIQHHLFRNIWNWGSLLIKFDCICWEGDDQRFVVFHKTRVLLHVSEEGSIVECKFIWFSYKIVDGYIPETCLDPPELEIQVQRERLNSILASHWRHPTSFWGPPIRSNMWCFTLVSPSGVCSRGSISLATHTDVIEHARDRASQADSIGKRPVLPWPGIVGTPLSLFKANTFETCLAPNAWDQSI